MGNGVTFLWHVVEYHSHLWTYSQNNQIFRQICIIGYSTKYYFKLTLKRIKENSNYSWPCHFLQKLDSDYLIMVSKFWLGVRIYWSIWDFQWFQIMSQNLLIKKLVWVGLIQWAEFPVRIFWSSVKFSNFQHTYHFKNENIAT